MQQLWTSLVAGAAASLAVPSAAQESSNETVGRGPAPQWAKASEPLPVPADASGLAFVRAQDTLVHLDESGQRTFVSQHIKLLHPQALQIGNIAFSWNPAVGAPVFHTLRIMRGSESIDVLGSAKFEVIRREDQLEQATLSGTLTAILKIPDLRVGDELEWAYTLPSSDPTLKDASSGALMLAGATLPGRYRLGLTWEQEQEPQIRVTDDFGAPLQRSANAFDVRVDNPSMLAPPKDAPPRYNWQRAIEYSDFASWQAISARFATLFDHARRLDPGSPIRAEAARIAATHQTPADRARAALALVQGQVRYIYVGLDGGNFQPAGADETWQRRYGDCKGKTALLLALLDELGIDGEPVLVNNSGGDDGHENRLPSPGLFDHVLVRATLDHQVLWLDGTLPEVVEMRPRPIFPYRWVLPLSPSGKALEQVPQSPDALPSEMGLVEIDARAGFGKPARKVHTIVKRGIDGVAQYLQLSALTNDQLTEGFRQAVAGGSEWDAVDSVTFRYDRATQASVLSITGTGPIEWEESEGRYDLSLPGGGFSPPTRRQRPGSNNQDAPYYLAPEYSCHATTIRLPETTALPNWGFNSTFDTLIFGRIYYRMMERRSDHTIRMVRGSRVERTEITVAEAQRDNERLARFDNSKANITYDPRRKMEPWGNLKPVPATYEIDWTGPSAPCLPSDVLRLR